MSGAAARTGDLINKVVKRLLYKSKGRPPKKSDNTEYNRSEYYWNYKNPEVHKY